MTTPLRSIRAVVAASVLGAVLASSLAAPASADVPLPVPDLGFYQGFYLPFNDVPLGDVGDAASTSEPHDHAVGARSVTAAGVVRVCHSGCDHGWTERVLVCCRGAGACWFDGEGCGGGVWSGFGDLRQWASAEISAMRMSHFMKIAGLALIAALAAGSAWSFGCPEPDQRSLRRIRSKGWLV